MTDHEARARELVELIGAEATDAVAILTRVLREAEAAVWQHIDEEAASLKLHGFPKDAERWYQEGWSAAWRALARCREQARRVREGT